MLNQIRGWPPHPVFLPGAYCTVVMWRLWGSFAPQRWKYTHWTLVPWRKKSLYCSCWEARTLFEFLLSLWKTYCVIRRVLLVKWRFPGQLFDSSKSEIYKRAICRSAGRAHRDVTLKYERHTARPLGSYCWLTSGQRDKGSVLWSIEYYSSLRPKQRQE